jgi:hypothetical protein
MGLCFINPKGDAADQILGKMPEDRVDDLVYLNPNLDTVPKINVLEPYIVEGMTRAEREHQKEIIVSDVVDLFRRYSKEWGDRFGRVLETLLRANLELNIEYGENNSLLDVYNAVVSDETLRDLIDRTDDPYLRSQLVNIRNLSSRDLEPLHRRLDDFVQNGVVRTVIDTGESSLDFRDIIARRKILLVDVQKGQLGKTSSQILGSIVTTQVWAAAQSRISMPVEERTPFSMYVDEVHNFGGDGSSFSKILAEAREYRLCLWLASQFLDQLEREMQRAVTNNCRSKTFFSPSDSDDSTRIAGMIRGISKPALDNLGTFRAVMQQPRTGTQDSAIIFDTLPPWIGDRDEDEIRQMKHEAAVIGGESVSSQESPSDIDLGPGGNAGKEFHRSLLETAKEYLESCPEVARVNLKFQDTGVEMPDGEIVMEDGTKANLEAEAGTLSNPAKVLKNLQRAAQQNRQCVFVVDQSKEDRLRDIITDPVNRRGNDHKDELGPFSYYSTTDGEFTDIDTIANADYRILIRTNGKIRDHETENQDDCPKLEDYTKQELVIGCPWRDEDICSLLDAPCVFHDGLRVDAV